MITVVIGPDPWLAQQHFRQIVARVDPNGFGTTSLDGGEATTQDLVNAVSTPPFFTDERLTILTNAFRRGKSAEDLDESKSGDHSIGLEAVISAIAEGNHLLLIDSSAASIPAKAKRILPADCQIFVGAPLRGNALLNWIIQQASTAGGKISRSEAQQLASRYYPQNWSSAANNPAFDRPPVHSLLAQEIEKLVIYAGAREISSSDIETLSPPEIVDTPFGLSNALLANNARAYLTALQRSIEAGDEANRLLATTQQQSELLLLVTASGRPVDSEETGRQIGLSNPKRMTALARNNQIDSKAVVTRAEQDLDRDVAAKTGRLPKQIDALYAATPSRSVDRQENPGNR